jgi:Flp pilus assembly protein TadG
MAPRPQRSSLVRRNGGQALAEFAMVAFWFFILVFGVIQIGLVMAAQNGLVDGVRTAARRAATYRINEASFDVTVWPTICTTIEDELKARLKSRVIGYNVAHLDYTITYDWQQNPQSSEHFLVAHIAATYGNPLYVPLIARFLDGTDGTVDNTLTLTASEQMRVENPALDGPSSTSPPCPAP